MSRGAHLQRQARTFSARACLCRTAKTASVVAQSLLVAAAAATFVALVLLPRLGLYRALTVLSGSMRPTFNAGDLIVLRPEPLRNIRVGQVISYQVPVGPHQVETHRVVAILHGGRTPTIRTQGDANNTADPWRARLTGNTAWRLAFVIPKGGYLVNALRSRDLHLATVLVLPVLFATLMLAQLWGRGRRHRSRADAA
jgi:signal peptidase I